jgi:hypothetical protein
MSKTRMIARAAIVVAALSTASAAVAAGVSLPAKANGHAVQATAKVKTGSANGKSDAVHPASTPSPNADSAFGQCVSDNAKTASDHAGTGGQTWNPTMGCTNTNASTHASFNTTRTTGLANAKTHANSHASGLQEASTKAHAH